MTTGLLSRHLRPLVLTVGRSMPLACMEDQSKISVAEVDHKHNMLRIHWSDGVVGQYPYVWLQDCAPPIGSAWHNSALNDARPLPLLSELNLTTKPEAVEVTPTGHGVIVQWPPYNKVTYKGAWLRLHHRIHTDHAKQFENVKLWDRSDMEKMFSGPPTVQASVKVKKQIEPIRSFLQSHGVVRVKHGVSFQKEIIDALGIDDIEKLPLSTRCSTSNVNDLHTTAPWMNPVPNLVALAFPRKPDCGQLQIVDGYMVAKKLRTTHPFTFRYLCTTPINYSNNGRRCDYDGPDTLVMLNRPLSKAPVFILNEEDGLHVDTVIFNNFARSARQEVPPDIMHELYSALKLFNSFCYDPANLLNIAPQEGDLFILRNDRVLHGTTAFRGSSESMQIVEELYYWKDRSNDTTGAQRSF